MDFKHGNSNSFETLLDYNYMINRFKKVFNFFNSMKFCTFCIINFAVVKI